MKRILALLFWLCGSVAFSQVLQSQSYSTLSVDGTKTQNTSEWSLNQAATPVPSATPLASPTPQYSSWYNLNGQQGVQMEFNTTGYIGQYGVQVSNYLPSSSATPGPNLYIPVQDATLATASGGAGTETKTWSYYIKNGWKWIRLWTNQPQSWSSTGTLTTQMRTFGPDASHPLQEGVPWQSCDTIATLTAQGGVTSLYYDYKLPTNARGFILYQTISALSATTTLSCSISYKDPVTGILTAVCTPVAAHTTGTTSFAVNPVANSSPPSGCTYVQAPNAQDVVITDTVGTGSAGTCTAIQDIVPIM